MVRRMDLRAHIVSIIADTLKLAPEKIMDDAKLIELAPDSIALFELLINFEKALGQTVRYEDVAHIETVGDIVAFAKTLPEDVAMAALGKYLTPAS